MHDRRLASLPIFIAAAMLMAACTGPGASPTAGSSCTEDDLATKVSGTLTIGTDNPAYPPYFDPPADGETAPSPWDEGLGDPTNGRGFESAVAYAVADQLGYTTEDVDWIAVPFDNSYAPGAKDFDFYLAQVSYADERAQSADLSDGYYFVNQALVARSGTPITDAGSIADLKDSKLGAAQGTTSYAFITDTIQPTQEASVYNTNDAAIAALNADQVDGIVVDLPTAFFITAAQMEDGVIVGQFASAGEGAEQEHFSLVLEKDSPLTDCVNQAIGALKDNGTLADITNQWMSENAGAPVLE